MKLLPIAANWRGFGKSMIIALIFWAVFFAGAAVDQLRKPNEALAGRKALLYQDFAQLGMYRTADLALPPDPNRIVFMGDSITYLWDLRESFPGKPYVNRGINAQTTSQMLVRFRQDVLDLQPVSVLILAGLNDLGDTSAAPTPIIDIERNLQSMAELSEAHHIRPVFASLLPVQASRFSLAVSGHIAQQILVINRWLRSYCSNKGYIYIDYYPAVVSSEGSIRRELTNDGVHPNLDGYRIMASIARGALSTKADANE